MVATCIMNVYWMNSNVETAFVLTSKNDVMMFAIVQMAPMSSIAVSFFKIKIMCEAHLEKSWANTMFLFTRFSEMILFLNSVSFLLNAIQIWTFYKINVYFYSVIVALRNWKISKVVESLMLNFIIHFHNVNFQTFQLCLRYVSDGNVWIFYISCSKHMTTSPSIEQR